MNAVDGPAFRRDLYRGTALDYDRFRVPYPGELIADLVRRAAADPGGRALDLACGTGQIAFAVREFFDEVWAVDQEPDMIEVVREKAAGAREVRALVASAEELAVPDGAFDLVAIGNAFHRLPRHRIAGLAHGWLRPGGRLALLWSESPWRGALPWQRDLAEVVTRWMDRAGGDERIPAGAEEERRRVPDREVLEGAGFEVLGKFSFPAPHTWTPEALVGNVFSTSVLSRAALGDRARHFEADVRHALSRHAGLTETIDFAYELGRRAAG
ncbi:class I SAM-dependent methyltransferase [Streptomyces griseorubiginosus]|uniref:class I SAM-dependent methyltransferase n=1 Tax=Streptomyces griseorubiginosus TaxID=67304 RepID=UPI001AD73BF7|nr:class I SAM-dependent methyltransferase [Streptomyces griseorubiginosus]MBO4258351.1 methyltransferase domain-containing protein [Streptomyces griseorubiginosus]